MTVVFDREEEIGGGGEEGGGECGDALETVLLKSGHAERGSFKEGLLRKKVRRGPDGGSQCRNQV